METLWIVLIIGLAAGLYAAYRLVAWVQGTSNPLDWTPTSPFGMQPLPPRPVSPDRSPARTAR